MIPEPKMENQFLEKRVGRGRNGYKPRFIVFHVQQGYNSLPDYFPTVPADSTIWGRRTQSYVRMLLDTDQTWTNGVPDHPNLDRHELIDTIRRGVYLGDVCLTIEHQGKFEEGYTEHQIEQTIELTAYWCEKWGIPADRDHLLLHSDIDSQSRKNCPGKLFPLDRIIEAVQKKLRDSGVVPPPSQETKVDKNARLFPETGFWVVNDINGNNIKFLDYWNNIGLPQLGYPISPAEYDDEFGCIIQWFERARLEYHPDNPYPFKVQEGLTGRESYEQHKEIKRLKAENDQLRADLAAAMKAANYNQPE